MREREKERGRICRGRDIKTERQIKKEKQKDRERERRRDILLKNNRDKEKMINKESVEKIKT